MGCQPGDFAYDHVNLPPGLCGYIWVNILTLSPRGDWGIVNIQIQSDRRHKLTLFMFQTKDKDLLGIYQYGYDPFCMSLLTDRHLKVRTNSILFTFSDKGALSSARELVASHVARKKVSS